MAQSISGDGGTVRSRSPCLAGSSQAPIPDAGYYDWRKISGLEAPWRPRSAFWCGMSSEIDGSRLKQASRLVAIKGNEYRPAVDQNDHGGHRHIGLALPPVRRDRRRRAMEFGLRRTRRPWLGVRRAQAYECHKFCRSEIESSIRRVPAASTDSPPGIRRPR